MWVHVFLEHAVLQYVRTATVVLHIRQDSRIKIALQSRNYFREFSNSCTYCNRSLRQATTTTFHVLLSWLLTTIPPFPIRSYTESVVSVY
jgi:hypothetical protein